MARFRAIAVMTNTPTTATWIAAGLIGIALFIAAMFLLFSAR